MGWVVACRVDCRISLTISSVLHFSNFSNLSLEKGLDLREEFTGGNDEGCWSSEEKDKESISSVVDLF